MEYINGTEISPLISKGICKVCYVGQQPNRNHTVITKEVATEMGRKLPGSPVVGYFNKDNEDFEGHNKEIIVSKGKYEIVDVTRPYGFVPTDANVWFQKFIDEGIEHEYLVTEVYIWTGAYPESQRILDKGNNQSMELDKENQSGIWTNDDKTNARIFIYNEALIEKLCVLGENVEPCFEGAQIGATFSLESSPEFQQFKATMFSMLSELQETLSKGGSQGTMDENKNMNPENQDNLPTEDHACGGGSTKEKDKDKNALACGGNGAGGEKKEEPKEKDGEEKKKNYNLEEVTEYTELLEKYNTLSTQFSALQQEKANLDDEVTSLKEFKLQAERQSKQAMIDSFYMLSDTDKKDVVDNIDNYSLDDIEAKLSIICVRNKVNFNLDSDKDNGKNENPQGLFNLNNAAESDNAPDWVKAIRETAKKQ